MKREEVVAVADAPLLEVRELSVGFTMYTDGFRQAALQVVSGLSLSVNPGEVVAVAGASGSGKSVLAHAILGLLPANATAGGQVLYKGKPLTEGDKARLRGSEIALVPQSVASLDPLMPVGRQVRGTGAGKRDKKTLRRIFERLDLCERSEGLYPFQLSGGMARRVLFSTAAISDAAVIIADEPTPGMHLEQAVRALGILRELADEGRAVLLITHDIDLAASFADRIAFFYAGATVEVAPAADFAAGPAALRHPYSKALWRALPQNGFVPIQGAQPYAGSLPAGCLFAPRCAHKTVECTGSAIPLRPLRGGEVRCLYAT